MAHTFRRSHDDGARCFGGRYHLLRHEDLVVDPERAAGDLFALAGTDLRAAVRDWVRENVRTPSPPYAADDPRWARSVERLGIADAITAAGYAVGG